MKVVIRLLNVFLLIAAHCAVVACGIGSIQTFNDGEYLSSVICGVMCAYMVLRLAAWWLKRLARNAGSL
jgi:hypothetical protein